MPTSVPIASPDTTLDLDLGGRALQLAAGDHPVQLTRLDAADGINAVRPHALVEVLTAAEGVDRMTSSTVGSAVGARLRLTEWSAHEGGATIEQADPVTGLRVVTRLELLPAAPGIRLQHTITAGEPVLLTGIATLSLRTAADPDDSTVVSGRSEWLGEGRWREDAVRDLLPDLGFALVNQPDRGGWGQASTGGWSTGSVLPTAALVSRGGASIAWQVESSAGWSWNLSRGDGGIVVTAGGPDDRRHDAGVALAAGESFTTVAATVVVGRDRDDAFGALTRARRATRVVREADASAPVVYNDYMNTLMGQPSTEALLPLIASAAEAGAEVFCIDAGWFTDSRDYWGEVGEWREAPTRFTGGLESVMDAINAAGMQPGLWIEPESVGLDSPVAGSLPTEAFFVRDGVAVVQQHRRHLDLRHPAARAHLDDTVDHLVQRYGVRYLKLDYNIEPGAGTDAGGLRPGHGMLEHTRALRDWLVAAQTRHPELLIENCASGAMRMDHHLLAVTHQQSTSDQQDAVLYSAIAASAPLMLVPEQAGNWAYPAAGMSRGELVTTLVNGLAGRLYLAGFLDQLSADQTALVHEAVALARSTRADLAASVPFWPLGLPGWHDDVIALGLERTDGSAVVTVWNRGDAGSTALPGVSDLGVLFPADSAWTASGSTVEFPAGVDAVVLEGRR